MSRIIREAKQSEWPTITKMLEAIQEHEQALVGYAMLPPKTMSKPYTAKARRILEAQDGTALVCETEDKLVGCLLGCTEKDDDLAVNDNFNRHALIMDIYVEPTSRKQGVARALIDAYADRMRARGCHWLRVWSKAKNQTAINTYLKYGFDPYETVFVKKL